MKPERVVVVGLGYVGLTLAVHAARRGQSVFGVDVSDLVIESLDRGKAHFFEKDFDPILKDLLRSGTLTYGREISEASGPQVFVITVGTPLRDDGSVNMELIRRAATSIVSHVRDGDLVVLRSTVSVGVTREVVAPILERSGHRILLAFCPERTIEGQALQELAELPQIVGGIDEESTVAASDFFKQLTREIVTVGRVEEAEMAKLVNNAERDVGFAFANEVALLCESRGLNVEDVIRACDHNYPRSGIKLPGLVGGPCLSKDAYILADGFRDAGAIPRIALASRRLNEDLARLPIDRLIRQLQGSGVEIRKAGVVGLAFKGRPPTSDLRGSLALPIIEHIQRRLPEAEVLGYDSLARTPDLDVLGIQRAHTLEEAFQGSALVLVQNNHPDFLNMDLTYLSGLMVDDGIIYDYWNLHPKAELQRGVRYWALGNSDLEWRDG